MHGDAPPPFDGEEAGLAPKATRKMIWVHMISWNIIGQSVDHPYRSSL